MPGKVPLVRTIDPIMDLNSPVVFGFNASASSVTQRLYTADSVSNSSIGWSNLFPPSDRNILDRRFMIMHEFLLSAVGDSGDPATPLVQLGSLDAVRAYPFLQAADQVNLQINGTAITQPLGDYVDMLMRYKDPLDNKQLFSGAAEKQDYYQEYSDFLALGSAQNVLGQNENGAEDLRGAHYGYRVLSNGQFAAEIIVRTFTPLTISPLLWGKETERGLAGVQTLNLNITFYTDLINRMWSRAVDLSTPFGAGTVISFTDPRLRKPELHIRYIMPKEMDAVPPRIEYAYENIQRYNHGDGLVPAGGTVTAQANNIKLNAIPNRVYIFFKRSNASRAVDRTDTYLRIDQVSVDFNSNSGLLASASSEDLYNISRQNGLRMSLQEWYRYSGSVLCLDFDKDLSMNSTDVVSELGSYQFAVNVTGTNLGSRDFTYTLQTVFVFSGTAVIENQQLHLTEGVVTESDVQQMKGHSDIAIQEDVYYGGSFGKKIVDYGRRAITKGKEFARSDLGKAAITATKEIAPLVLALMGAGIDRKDAIRSIAKQNGMRIKDVEAIFEKEGGNLGSGLMVSKGGKLGSGILARSRGSGLATKNKMKDDLYSRLS